MVTAGSIGDRLGRYSAKATGIKTIEVNRHEMARGKSIIPDLEVPDLRQFADKMKQLVR
jgi:hypothetical protein